MVPKIRAVKFEKTKKSPFKYGNRRFFRLLNFDGFLEPPGVQRLYVSHFKGLISGNWDFEAQGCDSTFTFLHVLLKKAILLHKRAIGP